MAIIVCPLSQVRAQIAARSPSHVVSLLDPHTPFPDAFDRPHLKVGVHDITVEMKGWTAPGRNHLTDILDFVGAWAREAPILIHCYAGISRSTATAYITACVHNPGHDEEEIAWALRGASPVAWPNKRLVALADAELGRGGRMARAIEAIGQGVSWEEAGENTPFEIPARFGAGGAA
jgi:predicted protein tyrosine phosphatase